MSYSSLLIHTVTIYNPEGSSGSEDENRYGDEEYGFDTGTAYPARVQQTGADENIIDRDTRTTTFDVFLPVTAVVSALSQMEWEDRLFRIVGEPDLLDGRVGPHHIELVAQEIAG